MSASSFIGLRYLRSKKSSAFLSLITFLSIFGVAIGVATLIIILSVMDGFEGALKSRLAQGDFHILVTRAANIEDSYFEFPVERLSGVYSLSPQILAVNPVLSTEAILRSGKKVAGMSLRGISEAQANQLAKQLVESSASSKTLSADGLWVGQELAYQLGVLPGDKVSMISPTETEGPMESVPRLRVFHVEGIFSSGIPEKDLHTVYAPIEAARNFLGRSGIVNQVEIQVRDFADSNGSADKIRAYLGPDFLVKDWNDLNAHLFASLRLERITMFIILTMIIVVASFNIVTSLRMTVIEKRKEISILQAMGASSRQIGRIFLIQGAVIGNVGTVLGVAVGLSISLLLKRYQFIELPDIFYDRSLPVHISIPFICGVAITSVIIVISASYFPARSATKIPPLEGIRDV